MAAIHERPQTGALHNLRCLTRFQGSTCECSGACHVEAAVAELHKRRDSQEVGCVLLNCCEEQRVITFDNLTDARGGSGGGGGDAQAQ